MNLTNFNKPLIIGLGILLILVLGITIWSLVAKTKQLPSQSLPQPSVPPTVDQPHLLYQYQGELPQLENTVDVYQINNQFELGSDLAQHLAASLDFSDTGKTLDDISGTVYLFNQGDNISLLIYPQPLRLEYLNTTQPFLTRLSDQALIGQATNFTNKSEIVSSPFALGKPYLEYQNTDFQGGLIKVNSPETAEFIQVSFDLLLNDKPVVPKDRQNAPIILLLNPGGTIRKATITLIPDQIQSVGQAELADPEAALQAINAGGGIISKLNNPKQVYTEITPGSIKTATLRSLEIVYLYDFDTNTLQPFYRFSGTANTITGEIIEVEVLITALPQEVYKQ